MAKLVGHLLSKGERKGFIGGDTLTWESELMHFAFDGPAMPRNLIMLLDDLRKAKCISSYKREKSMWKTEDDEEERRYILKDLDFDRLEKFEEYLTNNQGNEIRYEANWLFYKNKKISM